MTRNIYQIENNRPDILPLWAQDALRDPDNGAFQFAHFIDIHATYDFYGTREMYLDLKRWRRLNKRYHHIRRKGKIYDEINRTSCGT